MRPTFSQGPLPPAADGRRCPCCHWHPLDPSHPLNLCDECRVCLHCECRPSDTILGLCAACARSRFIHTLYERGRKFDPAWEQHIRRLTRWYQHEMAARGGHAKAAGAS